MPDNPRPLLRVKPSHQLSLNGVPIAAPPGPLRSSTLHQAGLPKLYDPGYATTAAFTSAITYIDGAKGILRHRGYPIADLVSQTDYLQLVHLLIYSSLPNPHQLLRFRDALHLYHGLHADVLAVITAFPRDAHPMNVLIAALSAMTTAQPDLNTALHGTAIYSHAPTREKAILKSLSAFPQIIAAIHRHTTGRTPILPPSPPSDMSFAERFLYMLTGQNPPAQMADALEKVLMLHADHEQNCSTATVRQLSSAGVDIFTCLGGGVAALYGPLHGGACEAVVRMLERIKDVAAVPMFLERVKRQEERLMGFGHRIYRNYDPRARQLHSISQSIFSSHAKDPLLQIATALEKAALSDSYFIDRKLYPNVDFYSGTIYRAMGFEPQFFPVLFALGRCGGWLAQWNEFLDDPDRRIARPHQRFVGEIGPRKVPEIDERRGRMGVSDAGAAFLVSKL